jgi:hypothetical protein
MLVSSRLHAETSEKAPIAAKCIRCGAAFSCNPTGVGTCWCMEKPPRPMPAEVTGCYCPACFELTDPSRKSHTAAL